VQYNATTCSFLILSSSFFTINKSFDTVEFKLLTFIHSVFCLTTGPKPPPKRFLHIVRSRASSFKWVTNSIAKFTARFSVTGYALYNTGMLNLLCDAGNFYEILSASERHEIEYTEWSVSNYTVTICIILPVYFSVRMCSENYTDNSKENRKKCNIQPRLGCRYF
jgi:hypothetical protein